MGAPPFTIAQFFGVFADYNAAIWPLQIVAFGLGILAVLALWLRWPLANRVIFAVLAIVWAVNGIGYHWLYFAEINPVAKGFAVAFVAQSILFAASALIANDFRFEVGRNVRSAAGLSAIAYALLIYPLFGCWAGHGLMAGPLFGVAPCPTTIYTIGMLLLARSSRLVWLSIIPILWSLVGLAAALQLGMPEDFGLPVAALALVIAVAVRPPSVSAVARSGRPSP
jgi:Family of unknown function (DUF6064)